VEVFILVTGLIISSKGKELWYGKIKNILVIGSKMSLMDMALWCGMMRNQIKSL